jgi:hypothetical protein
MYLIEHKYLPKSLDDIIIPNKTEILNQVKTHILNNKMNLLIIGNYTTLKIKLIELIVKQYYTTHNNFNYTDYVLNIDCFNDINLSNEINELKTFCKTIKPYKKFVIIDNFEIITESNQQYIKSIIDTTDTFFICGCDNTSKVNEIIQTRMTPIMIQEYEKPEYKQLIEYIMVNENITFDMDTLLQYNNLSPYLIFNLFNKLKLLGLNDVPHIMDYVNILDYKLFDKYTSYIINKDVKNATNILFKLYDDGMSLLDIYNFLYEYYKLITDTYKYKFMEQLCKYIKYIYDGHYNKIMLLFFTNDIIYIYNTIP